MKRIINITVFLILITVVILPVFAQEKEKGIIPTQDFIKREDNPEKVITTLEIMFLLTILALAPSILVMVTSFTRIVIVLSFIRRALATQDIPPNQVIIGLSLILTFTVMSPTIRAIKRDALDPYTSTDPAKQITQEVAFKRAVHHLRQFMFAQTRLKDIKLFMDINNIGVQGQITQKDVPTEIIIPAFVISELRRAFIMGFALFLPFMVIDLVVSTALISMGMLVLPPILISLPFKILLFILVDGWHLLIGSLVRSFNT
jgi:flagellar biosynthetic protein FliP